jgi:polar amino acid transport system substrate-binding protein
VKRICFLIFFCFVLLTCRTGAQDVETGQAYRGKPLILGFSSTSLDVVKRENPRWLKSYVDFWELIAHELKRPCVFKAMTFDEITKALHAGTIDITAVPLAVTASREEAFDLSAPLGGGRLAVATRHNMWDHPLVSAIQIFFSWTSLKVVLLLMAALVLIGTITWLIERKDNPEYFGQGTGRGIGTGIFWAGSTLASGICLGISLKTPLGRVLGLFWMVVCVVLFGAVIASLTYYLGAQQYSAWPLDSAKLRHMRLGMFRASAQIQMIGKLGIRHTPCDDTEDCIAALLNKRIDGFLYDEGYLRYLSETRYRGKISVYSTELSPYRRAFAMPKNSPLRKSFNVALLRVTERPMGEALVNQLDLSQYLKARAPSPMEETRRFGAGRGKR